MQSLKEMMNKAKIEIIRQKQTVNLVGDVDGNYMIRLDQLIPLEEVESVSIWIPIVKAYRYETIPIDDQNKIMEQCGIHL